MNILVQEHKLDDSKHKEQTIGIFLIDQLINVIIAQSMVWDKTCFHFQVKTTKILTKIVTASKQQMWIVSNYPLPRGQVKNGNYSHGSIISLII